MPLGTSGAGAAAILSVLCLKEACSVDDLWPRPELSVSHGEFDLPTVVDVDLLDKAFPDLNCDRADGGRWRMLRLELQVLLDTGFGQEAAEDFLRWKDVLSSWERIHGLSGWLYPKVGPDWVEGFGVAAMLGNFSTPVPCVLGVATVVLVSLMVTLAEAYSRNAYGREDMLDYLDKGHFRKAHVLQIALMRVFPRSGHRGGHGIITQLPATRWPLLDLLAAIEKVILGGIHSVIMFDALGGDCVNSLGPRWKYLVELAHQLADMPADGNAAGSGKVRWNVLLRLFRILDEQRRSTPRTDESVTTNFRCMPRLLVYELLNSYLCAQQQTTDADHPDPENCLRTLSFAGSVSSLFFPPSSLPYWFLFMDLSRFRFFGVWRQLRQVLSHRMELPFHSTCEMGSSFGVQVRDCAASTCSTGSRQFSEADAAGHRRAAAAFDSLQARQEQVEKASRSTVFLSACWGEKYASRLGHWLSAGHRAGIAEHTILMCHDNKAFSTCHAVHPWPELCADARAWPRSLVSKLVGVVLCLQRGLDVMWLDSDVAILRDPRPHLKPVGGGDADLLFSVEPNSWNCINAGVFFVRATSVTQRYLAYWISLLLERPSVIDQAVAFLLLGLFPKMDYQQFLEREQLLQGGPRVEALGNFRTPVWGSLESQTAFGMTSKVTYGGFKAGGADNLVLLHLLESWPNESVVWPIFHDIADPVGTILEGLAGQGHGQDFALTLIKRSETKLDYNIMRNCRTSFSHGR